MSEKTPAQIEAEFVALVQGLKQVEALAESVASVRMRFYHEYLAAGFTEEQALELCKNVSVV